MDRHMLTFTYDFIDYSPTSKEWLNIKNKKCDPFCALILADGDRKEEDLSRELDGKSIWESCEVLGDISGYEPSYVLGFTAAFSNKEQADTLDYFEDKDIDLDKFMDGFTDGIDCMILEIYL